MAWAEVVRPFGARFGISSISTPGVQQKMWDTISLNRGGELYSGTPALPLIGDALGFPRIVESAQDCGIVQKLRGVIVMYAPLRIETDFCCVWRVLGQQLFAEASHCSGRKHLSQGWRSCEKENNLTQSPITGLRWSPSDSRNRRRQGTKIAKNNCFVFFAPSAALSVG